MSRGKKKHTENHKKKTQAYQARRSKPGYPKGGYNDVRLPVMKVV